MKFAIFHAPRNDYIVLSPKEHSARPNPAEIGAICGCHYGVGSDGILQGPLNHYTRSFALEIFDSDTSEAETNSSGLIIVQAKLLSPGNDHTNVSHQ